MKLLLHACCADCILKFIDSINQENLEIDEVIAFFYNPNIHPRSEYLSRLKAIQKVTEENKIKLIVPDWSPKEWFKLQNPFKQNPPVSTFVETSSLKKGGSPQNKTRCEKCWQLRLKKSFEYAKENNFELVSSTLITSHYQNQKTIKEIAKNLEEKYKIKFLVPKKVSRDLKTSGFYKQNYCGCAYSLVVVWEDKFN